MKLSFIAIALFASTEAIAVNKPSSLVSGEEGIYRPRPYTYTYNDIRDKELKCVADRNREWHYYANNNTWECPLKAYPWMLWGVLTDFINNMEGNQPYLFKIDKKFIIQKLLM